MFKEFPRIDIPVGLEINQKKVLIFLLIYEAGFYDVPPGNYVRNKILYQLGKNFPNLTLESPEHMVKLKEFNDELNKLDIQVSAKAYEHFVGVAKSTKLWNILKPRENEILQEVERCLHENSTITEVDWLQILFDLKISTEGDKEYYRSVVLEQGYKIVDSIDVLDEIAEEFILSGSETLPNDEVIRLFREIADEHTSPQRKQDIKNTLFMVNKRLVPFVLEKMKSFANYTPARDREDDLQEGLSALWLAIEKFDVCKGNQFSTYAVQCIRGNILRFRNKNRFLQHVPENQNLNYQKAVKFKNRKEVELGREITIHEWAKLMEIPVYKLTKLLDIHKETVYFGSPVHSSSDDLLLEEVLADSTNVEDEVMEMSLSEELAELLGRLDQREEDILRLRCGFYHTPQELLHARMKLGREVHPNEPVTFEEIAKAYGITRERVRQILDNACHTLRHPSIMTRILNYREDIDEVHA